MKGGTKPFCPALCFLYLCSKIGLYIYDLTIYDVRLKFVLLNNRAYAGIYDTKSNRTS